MTRPDDGSITWLREFIIERINANRDLAQKDFEKIEVD